MSISKVTPIGRASFPKLASVDQYGKYGVAILLPKSDPAVVEFAKWLKDAVTKEATAVAGAAGLTAAMAEFGAFKDGDNVAAFKTYRNEYAGHYILNTSRKADFGKVCCVNRAKQPIDPSEIYAGCNVLAFIDVFGYTFGSKKSVSIGIQHIMKTGENTPFSATGVKVDDAFSGLDIPPEGEIVTEGAPAGAMAAPPVAPAPAPEAAAVPPANNPFAGV